MVRLIADHPVEQTKVAGRALRLSDTGLIDRCLPTGPFVPAEFCFANLWLFRARHDYRLLEDPVLHIRGRTYDGAVHAILLEPPGRESAAALFADGVDCLFPYGENGPELAEQLGLQVVHNDADSDYWYSAQDMSDLGRAKQRRAQARAYGQEAAPVFHPWHQGLADLARTILFGWAEDVDRPALATDLAECLEAIEQSDALGLEGGLVTARDRPVALLLASRSGSARVVHFAKGRRSDSAAYPWMFATYARVSGADWMNFEQDLGNPGLARSKRAYAPVRRQPKYRLRKCLPF